ncbi:hypothetical protein LCGC14_2924400 [marine sediment metagenome]|uniref:Uncharacterized protein n=1 Tax=marine sediment metagenome TaxID=412755 RepID=A0A0F9ADX3_9ZZZZ
MEEIYIICELKNFLEYERDRKGEFAIITLTLYAVKNESDSALAPKYLTINISRIIPKIRLRKVKPPTSMVFFTIVFLLNIQDWRASVFGVSIKIELTNSLV